MLNLIGAILCLLITGVSGNSEPVINEIEHEESILEEGVLLENVRWPRVFEIFEACELTCHGKTCKCCHLLLNVLPVCGTLYIDPTIKTAEISLTITGRKAISAIISLNRFLKICHNVKTNFGEVDLCANTTISEHKTNPDFFRLCVEAEVQLNKVKHLHVIGNCLEVKGDLIFESGDDMGTGKNIASVRILNQMILADIIRKAVTDNIIGSIEFCENDFDVYETILHGDKIDVIENNFDGHETVMNGD